jgi:hypothetical protein
MNIERFMESLPLSSIKLWIRLLKATPTNSSMLIVGSLTLPLPRLENTERTSIGHGDLPHTLIQRLELQSAGIPKSKTTILPRANLPLLEKSLATSPPWSGKEWNQWALDSCKDLNGMDSPLMSSRTTTQLLIMLVSTHKMCLSQSDDLDILKIENK